MKSKLQSEMINISLTLESQTVGRKFSFWKRSYVVFITRGTFCRKVVK